MEMTHFQACARLLEKYEGRDIREVVKPKVIELLVIFEPNKEYVNEVIEKSSTSRLTTWSSGRYATCLMTCQVSVTRAR
jgi:hypothetical protein